MAGRAPTTLPLPSSESLEGLGILIIEARFHEAIIAELAAGAIAELEALGIEYERIVVPGALEIPQVLSAALDAGVIPSEAEDAKFCGVVALGCVIRGDTTHYEIVCENANHWLMEIAIRDGVPVGNAILTVENEEQAMERARGGRQNKGAEAVRACLSVVAAARHFQSEAD